MSDEQTEIRPDYAVALGLAWLLFPDEPREVIEERARNFLANMERVQPAAASQSHGDFRR